MNKKINKVIVFGDTHGKNKWEFVNKEDANKVVFLGDYFDSFTVPFEEQMSNFLEIVDYKEKNPDKVVLLFGNHDYHYLSDTDEHYSGFQYEKKNLISLVLEKAINEDVIQMCYIYNDFLFTHAGVTNTWFVNNIEKDGNIRDCMNKLLKTNPSVFKFTSSNPMDNCGDSITQSPIWVRPRALLSDLITGFTQVVGHTHVTNIDINNEVIFVDTLEYGNEYLIINKNVPEIGIIEKHEETEGEKSN